MGFAIIELGSDKPHGASLDLDLAGEESAGQILEALKAHGYGQRPVQMLIRNGTRSLRIRVPDEESAPVTVARAIEMLLS